MKTRLGFGFTVPWATYGYFYCKAWLTTLLTQNKTKKRIPLRGACEKSFREADYWGIFFVRKKTTFQERPRWVGKFSPRAFVGETCAPFEINPKWFGSTRKNTLEKYGNDVLVLVSTIKKGTWRLESFSEYTGNMGAINPSQTQFLDSKELVGFPVETVLPPPQKKMPDSYECSKLPLLDSCRRGGPARYRFL